MFSFLLPKPVQQGRQFIKDARKILQYKRDLWEPETVTDFQRHIQELEAGCKEQDTKKIKAAAEALNAICTAMLPKVGATAWRETLLGEEFHLNPTRDFHKGDAIFCGYIQTGDHVFVDEISYQFRPPRRGDVIVFNTEHLPTVERRQSQSFEPNDPTQFDNPVAAIRLMLARVT